ncbi:hypothetical protein F5887DRAFT_1075180 [Amanita rubescens]|nr:hypothetical protein F5887DRAFT_1075180 [Amanita rubescens]
MPQYQHVGTTVKAGCVGREVEQTLGAILRWLLCEASKIFEEIDSSYAQYTWGSDRPWIDFAGRDQRTLTIPSFIHRSSCQLLKHLSLWYSKPDTAAELSRIPDLPSLLFRDHASIRKSIKLLNCDMPEGAPLLAPWLKSLKIEIVDTSEHMKELSVMVASRARNPGVDGLDSELSLGTYSVKPGGDLTTLQEQCEQHNNVKLIVAVCDLVNGRVRMPVVNKRIASSPSYVPRNWTKRPSTAKKVTITRDFPVITIHHQDLSLNIRKDRERRWFISGSSVVHHDHDLIIGHDDSTNGLEFVVPWSVANHQ